MSQPVNVTVEYNDEYQSFALVNDSYIHGVIYSKFYLLQNNGKPRDITKHLHHQENIPFGDCLQVEVFTFVFNDTLLAESLEPYADELLIKVQFHYKSYQTSDKNASSDIAYIRVLLDSFNKDATIIVSTSSTNPASTDSKNATSIGDLSYGSSPNISGSLSLQSMYSYKMVVLLLNYVSTLAL